MITQIERGYSRGVAVGYGVAMRAGVPLQSAATISVWQAPMPTAEFWYELASTYSYPAAMRVDALASARSVELAWRPFLLGPIFAAQGWRDSPFNLYPAKGRYMWRDLARICDGLGLTLTRPNPFPQNSLFAARVALALDGAERAEFSRQVYLAEFGAGLPIADRATLAAALQRLRSIPSRC